MDDEDGEDGEDGEEGDDGKNGEDGEPGEDGSCRDSSHQGRGTSHGGQHHQVLLRKKMM